MMVVATCSLWRLVEAVPGWCGTVPRSELCRESIVWHEGREARPGSASQDGGEQRGSVAGRGLPGDEGMLMVVQKSNK